MKKGKKNFADFSEVQNKPVVHFYDFCFFCHFEKEGSAQEIYHIYWCGKFTGLSIN